MAAGTIASFAESTVNYEETLGTVMYVGDSITHGVNSASWRWAFHKILVDNGISYDAVGYKTGNYSNGVSAGTEYGGVAFNNAHSAQSSARAYEISARKAATRFDGTNIKNWLGQSSTTYAGATYTGPVFDNVDTFFIMIGTNDLLSDYKDNPNEAAVTALLGDMGTIFDAMFTNNEDAEVKVFSIPCWTAHGNNTSEAVHAWVQSYNEQLQEYIATYNTTNGTNIQYVDVNYGILDVAATTSFYGCSSMFNNPGTATSNDGLHPNAQGDLLIAGNLAKAMGYAGRSAGQERVAGTDFSIQLSSTDSFTTTTNVAAGTTAGTFDLGSTGTSNLTYTWAAGTDLSNGFTLDFSVVLGNGSTGGWNTTDDLSISLGNGEFYGTLNINEAYIKWGDTVIFSTDMSALDENIRIAYITGNTTEGLSKGYYVWLGDMLIGEALTRTYAADATDGVSITFSAAGTVLISDIALESVSYAPTTTGIVNESEAYIATPQPPSTKGVLGIQDDWTADTTIAASGQFAYANTGDHSGNVYAEIMSGSASSWIGAHSSGTQAGDVYLRVGGTFTGTSTAFGVVNGTSVEGDVYLELSAEDATYTTFTTKTTAVSVVGAYATSINGNLDIVINDGTFTSAISGGVYTGTNTISGNTSIYINGGTFSGNIYAGGLTGTQGGDVLIAISGNAANFTSSTIISGGVLASAASIGGNSTILIKDVTSGPELYSIDKFTGTLTGGTGVTGTRSLVIDNAVLDLSGATLTNFDIVSICNSADIKISSFGGAGTVTIDGTSTVLQSSKISAFQTLTVADGASFTGTISSAGTLFVDVSDSVDNSYSVKLGGLVQGESLNNVRFVVGDKYYAAEISNDVDWQAGTATVILGDAITTPISVISETSSSSFVINAAAGITSGDAQIISNGATTAGTVYANSGDYTGNLDVTINAGSMTISNGTAGWVGAHTSGTLTGDVYLRIAGDFTNAGTVFGIVNGTKVTGNVTLELSAENASYTTFTKNNAGSVIGAFNGSIDGDLNIIINAGTFANAIMGGIQTGSSYSIGGNVNITVNGGTINGNIYGGGVTGTISGGTNIVIDDSAGTLTFGNAITITGGGISASAGTIGGNASITLKNLGSSFDSFAGTISGGDNVSGTKTLTLDAVTANLSNATISDFASITVQNSSNTTLASIDLDSTALTISGSSLTINSVTGTLNFSDLNGTGTVKMDESAKFQTSAAFALNAEAVGTFISDATITLSDSTGTYNLTGIETATLTLAGTQNLTVTNIASGTTTLSGTSAMIATAGTLGDLTISDSATLTVAGTVSAEMADLSNAGAGALVIEDGATFVAETLAIGDVAGTLQVGNGAALGFDAFTGTLVFSQHNGVGNIWTHETSVTMAVSFGIDDGLTGTIISTDGNVNFANFAGTYSLANLQTGTLAVAGTQTLAVSGTTIVRDATTLSENAKVSLEEAVLGDLTMSNDATLAVAGTVAVGDVTMIGNAELTVVSASIDELDLSGNATINFEESLSADSLTLASDSSITLAGTGTSAGTLAVGDITISDSLENFELTISNATIEGNVELNGATNTLSLENVTITGDLLPYAGTLNYSGTNVVQGGMLVQSAVSLIGGNVTLNAANATLVLDSATIEGSLDAIAGTLKLEGESAIANGQTIGADVQLISAAGSNSTVAGTVSGTLTVEADSTLTQTGATSSIAEIVVESATFVQESGTAESVTLDDSTATIAGTVGTLTAENDSNLVQNAGTIETVSMNASTFTQNAGTAGTVTLENSATATLAGTVENLTVTESSTATISGKITGTTAISDGATATSTGTLGAVSVDNATFTQSAGTLASLTATSAKIVNLTNVSGDVSLTNSKMTTMLAGKIAGTTTLSNAALAVDSTGTLGAATLTNGARVVTSGTLALNVKQNEKVSLDAGTSWTIRQGAKLSLSYSDSAKSVRQFADTSSAETLANYLLNGGEVTIFDGAGTLSFASKSTTIETFLATDATLAALAADNLVAYDLSNGLSVHVSTAEELFGAISVPAQFQSLFDAVSSDKITGFVNFEATATSTIDDPIVKALLTSQSAGTQALATLSPLAYASMIAIPQAVHGNDIRAISGRLDARRYDRFTGKDEAEVFVQVSGQNTENDTGTSSPNYDFYTTGVLMGIDTKVSNGSVFGAAVGADFGRAKIHHGGGKIESSNLRLNLFAGTLISDCIYVNAGTHFGFGSYDIKRSTVLGRGEDDTTGINLGANIEVGCLVPLSPEIGLFAMPHIGAAYLFSRVENIDDGIFDVDSFDRNSVRGNVGVTFAWQAAEAFRVTLDFSYSHEFCDDETSIDYAYNGAGLSIDAPIDAEDVFSGTLGFEARLSRTQSLYGGYTFATGSHSEISHSVNVGLRARF